MTTKKLIERNLKFDQKYVYLGITRGNIMDGQCCSCDNCGKLIANMVTVVNQDTKKQYTIGTDCAETLSKAGTLYNNGTATDFYLDIYCFNKTARVATEIRKGKTYDCPDGFTVYILNDKGKEIYCMLHELKKFFPELVQEV